MNNKSSFSAGAPASDIQADQPRYKTATRDTPCLIRLSFIFENGDRDLGTRDVQQQEKNTKSPLERQIHSRQRAALTYPRPRSSTFSLNEQQQEQCCAQAVAVAIATRNVLQEEEV